MLMQIGSGGEITAYVPLKDKNGNAYITGMNMSGYLTGQRWNPTASGLTYTGDNLV